MSLDRFVLGLGGRLEPAHQRAGVCFCGSGVLGFWVIVRSVLSSSGDGFFGVGDGFWCGES